MKRIEDHVLVALADGDRFVGAAQGDRLDDGSLNLGLLPGFGPDTVLFNLACAESEETLTYVEERYPSCTRRQVFAKFELGRI